MDVAMYVAVTHFTLLAEIAINRISKRHLYNSHALSKLTSFVFLRLRISTTICSHVQFGTFKVLPKKRFRFGGLTCGRLSEYSWASVCVVVILTGESQTQFSA